MDNVKKNKWFIAIKERGVELFDMSGFKVIEPAEGTYHADPFLFKELIFFELYDYQKGVIACMDKDGKNMKLVLERPYHLSFPFIIEDYGEIYMVPECSRGIELYRCVKFPDKWEFIMTLVEGSFADTTILKCDKEFLMFTTEGDNNLRIFKAQAITGPWERIYSDAHMHSRGAGNIFEMGGKLVRPTQDGEVYGKQIYFKEIRMPYKEKIIGEIKPNWIPNLTGTHTFNFDDDHVIIDGRVKL